MSRMATQMSRMATNATGGTAEQGGYSLAGSQTKENRGGPSRDTYVAEGYRNLNPQYEKKQNEPTFSLGSNLPRTVRGWQGKKKNEGPNSSGTAPGVKPAEKGEGEAAPQLQDADERKKHRGGEKQDPEPSDEQKRENHGSTQSNQTGDMRMHETSAQAGDGENTGVISDEAVYSPSDDSDDTAVTPEDEEVVDEPAPFNSWALVRAKFQDALGEWLGVSLAFSTATIFMLTLSADYHFRRYRSQQQSCCSNWRIPTPRNLPKHVLGLGIGCHVGHLHLGWKLRCTSQPSRFNPSMDLRKLCTGQVSVSTRLTKPTARISCSQASGLYPLPNPRRLHRWPHRHSHLP
jgi:hypothetical protein